MKDDFFVLVDSSVWVDYFRYGHAQLAAFLQDERVLTHEMVIGELTCGTPPSPRANTLGSLRFLKACIQAQNDEVCDMIERYKFYGRGCGWVDMNLLASAMLTPETKLWTLDAHLQKMAQQMGVAYQIELH